MHMMRSTAWQVLKSRIEESGMPLEPYEGYLDLRKYGENREFISTNYLCDLTVNTLVMLTCLFCCKGTVPHSGFGLGFERLVLFATGLSNIRDVIPFPRFPGNAAY